MEKKICPWCGKTIIVHEHYNGEYVCPCDDFTALIKDKLGKRLVFRGTDVDKLIAMKAEHAQLKAEAERTRWHSVKEEGLPTELRKQYLIKPKIGKTIVDILWEYIDEETGEQCIALGDYGEDEVVAWTELPQPYKNN